MHISREELHALEVPGSFETSETFYVRLINHREALHVHLHLDDPLSQVASIDAGNHYIERDSERRVRVTVDVDKLEDESLLGKLKVASGYGAETRWIDVKVTEPNPESESVEIDESLAQPQPREPEPQPLLTPELQVILLGAVAVVLAGVTALVIDSQIVVYGALIVLVGFLIGLYFLLS